MFDPEYGYMGGWHGVSRHCSLESNVVRYVTGLDHFGKMPAGSILTHPEISFILEL